MSCSVLVYVGTALLLLVFLLKRVLHVLSSTKHGPYPPGPPGKLLVGNMFDFPTKDPGGVYEMWGKRYNSGIVHGSALGNHVVVVNDLDIADELFEKRAKVYSDRPEIPMLDLIGWDYNFPLFRYGQVWRNHRKMAQQHFNKNAARVFQPIQLRRVRQMLQGLLDSPEQFESHNKMLSVSISMEMMYGYDVKSLADPCIQAADKTVELGSGLLVPGASFINVFPFLRHIPAWFPGATSRKAAAQALRWSHEMQRLPMEYVRRSMSEGTASPSFVSNFLERKTTEGAAANEEAIVKNVAFTVYGAASDTTIAVTGSFLYLMVQHPEVQEKAQAELDQVLGGHRLPEFEDRASLPYIEAVYRETMRCQPPLHLGAPHAASEDDVYNGFFIPKGSTVFGNIWAMTHDESKYPEPFKFQPERFFNEKGVLNDDNRILAYGFGRRVCVGKHVASSTMWIIIASILACFDIRKAKDQFGNDIEINGDYEDLGFIRHKKPFECSVHPRSDIARRLIEESASL